VDSFGRSRGLSGDSVLDLFEDREGNVWVSTTEGLDRFRELAAATITADQGLPPGGISSVMAARDGSVWVGATPALSRWHDGQWTVFRTPRDKRVSGLPAGSSSLYQDSRGRVWFGGHGGLSYLENDRFIAVGGVPGGYVDEIAEDRAGNLWIAHRSAGLLRLSPDLEVQRIAWSELGSGRPARRIAFDPIRGGLWLGYVAGDVSYVQDGKVHATYTAANGLGRGIVNQVRVGADGAVWVATEGGLSRLKGGRVMTLSGRNGLPCDTVKWMLYGDDVWLYLGCGVARIARAELDAWAAAGDEGKAADRGVRATVFDSSDGIRSERIPGSSSPSAARSRDGKLWFAAAGGVSVLDPRSLPHNALPPPVHIEQVVADRKTYEASSQLRLPPLVRDLQIDYTALSLVAPEKNRFRYKLEGRDRDWQDADNRRQAFYTDLGPGNYRFRVIASNNSGVWNEKGAALDFSVAPAYWQTNWFRALCVAALVVLLWALYRLRLRQVRRQFSATLEARVNERTRIARELHDTLLQSFHGLLLRFQTVVELLPGRPAEAKKLLEGTIDQAAGAITEGRDAVQGLRSSVAESNDLAEALRTLGEQLAAEEDGDDRVTLCVEVQGVPRTLHPILRDDVFRIGGEAMRNAFRHAGAKRIEVELRYDAEGLRLRVRDDGKGIAPEVLTLGGREGHFGLHGMRERASLIGGKLTVWSAPDSGTEVELSIPASHAYAASLST
jgi:signal transduction histidine kinase